MRPRTACLIAAAITLTGCFEDPEQAARLASLEAENGTLKDENRRLDREADALLARNRALEEQVKTLEKQAALARLGADADDNVVAVLDTSAGRIVCTLFQAEAPRTVLNFVQLAEGTRDWTDPTSGASVRRPLYNGTVFHRVIPGFMVQGGDPEGTGRGGPGYTFADETDAGRGFEQANLLAMANRGPDTNGSQFFITDRGTPRHLDGKHTIFGSCENPEVVQAIAESERDSTDRPLRPVVLERVRIFREAR